MKALSNKSRWQLLLAIIALGLAFAWFYASGILYKPAITLSKADIIKHSREAAAGSIQSANKLRSHYLIARPEPSIGYLWHEIAARNGDLDAQQSIAKEILKAGWDAYRTKLQRTNQISEQMIDGWIKDLSKSDAS